MDSPIKSPIEIIEYSKEKLLEIFLRDKITSKEMIKRKTLIEYFQEYLSSKYMGAKTIVIENDYIDRDFLEDFSAYYVRCFTDYKRKCVRLHFFSNRFIEDEFYSFLEKFDPKFQDVLYLNYLGFIVVKPLPQTIIGRTCLKTYKEKNDSEDKRVYPITISNDVNLCGINLNIQSLSFQEQDSVVSACATSALWSAFQVTAKLFQHKILSPVEITKSATKHFPLEERPFPNKGLNIEQMMHAIQELDMEPFVVYVEDDEYTLKNCIYSYLTYGIPIILVIDLYDTNAEEGKEYVGSHAVVITGYRLEKKGASYPPDKLRLVSSKMTKFYVHDDQIGPFAKMKFDDKKIKIKELDENKWIESTTLETEWKFRAVPKAILIPLYHKIRIPLENVLLIIELFNLIIDNSIDHIKDEVLPGEKLEWSILLTNVNKYKGDILDKSGKDGNFKGNFKGILEKSMPRFIWKATALYMENPLMDLLFDATDIEQGDFFLGGVVYNRELFSKIHLLIKSPEVESNPLMIYPVGKSILDWINKVE